MKSKEINIFIIIILCIIGCSKKEETIKENTKIKQDFFSALTIKEIDSILLKDYNMKSEGLFIQTKKINDSISYSVVINDKTEGFGKLTLIKKGKTIYKAKKSKLLPKVLARKSGNTKEEPQVYCDIHDEGDPECIFTVQELKEVVLNAKRYTREDFIEQLENLVFLNMLDYAELQYLNAISFIDDLWEQNNGYRKIRYNLEDFPCQKQILERMIATTSPLTKLLKEIFDSSDKINLTFLNKDFDAFQAEARINPNISKNFDGSYTIYIELNNNFLRRSTDLGIVATTLHESIHAYMLHLHQQGQLSKTSGKYTKLEELLTEFYNGKRNKKLSIDLHNEHHNVMKDFISKIGKTIYEFAEENGIKVSRSYCNHLAWGTMHNTPLFEAMLSEAEQIEYNNIFYTEAYNEQNEDYVPQGTPCN